MAKHGPKVDGVAQPQERVKEVVLPEAVQESASDQDVCLNVKALTNPNPCQCCGSDSIDVTSQFLADDGPDGLPVEDPNGEWHISCHNCERSQPVEYSCGKTREEALVIWNERNPSMGEGMNGSLPQKALTNGQAAEFLHSYLGTTTPEELVSVVRTLNEDLAKAEAALRSMESAGSKLSDAVVRATDSPTSPITKFTNSEIAFLEMHPEALRLVADYHDLQQCQGEPMGFDCIRNRERQRELNAEAERLHNEYDGEGKALTREPSTTDTPEAKERILAAAHKHGVLFVEF